MFRNFSMTIKLMIALMTVALVVSIWMVVFSVVRSNESDMLHFRQTMQISADLVALNSKPALLFDDERGASGNLAAFHAVPDIIGAQIRRPDGSIFVEYRKRTDVRMPDSPGAGDRDHVLTVSDIQDGDERLGTLIVLSETSSIRNKFVGNLVRVGSAGAIAVIIAVLLTAYFRKDLVTPILSLAESATSVAEGHEFSKPIAVSGNDEIGRLIHAFNLMMAQLRQRDEKLQNYNAELERQVEIRTAELVSAKKLAEEASRVKSDFVAIMSHEIRTPMNAIIGLSRLALNRATSPGMRDYLEKICYSSQGLLGILNGILDYSKLQAGAVAIEHAPFELDAVLGNLQTLFGEHARSKGLGFGIAVTGDTPLSLVGDELRIQQVLSNLVGNAIKFTDQGRVAVSVGLLRWRGELARLRFAVEDTGIGMSAAQIGRLFQPFSQVDGSITRRFGGTGLGLAISSDLLKLLGGHIEVASREGVGTTFSFELELRLNPDRTPRQASGPSRTAAGRLQVEIESAARKLKGARILVAEDEVINRQVVGEFLTLAGIESYFANDGQQALDWLERMTFDAVLMDLHMPVMSGADATSRIRARPEFADLPIVALTAGVSQLERDACIAAGMNDFAAKPVEPQSLIACLNRWIRFPLCREAAVRHPREDRERLNLVVVSDSVDRMNAIGSALGGRFRVRMAHSVDAVRDACVRGYAPALLLLDHSVEGDVAGLMAEMDRAGMARPRIVRLEAEGADRARGEEAGAPVDGEQVVRVTFPCDPGMLLALGAGTMQT